MHIGKLGSSRYRNCPLTLSLFQICTFSIHCIIPVALSLPTDSRWPSQNTRVVAKIKYLYNRLSHYNIWSPTASIATKINRITISPLSIVKWEIDIPHSTFSQPISYFSLRPEEWEWGSPKYFSIIWLSLHLSASGRYESKGSPPFWSFN